jgi:hypothetical protein
VLAPLLVMPERAAITNVLGEWARLRGEYTRAADLYEPCIANSLLTAQSRLIIMRE